MLCDPQPLSSLIMIHVTSYGHLGHEPGRCFFSEPRLERLAAPKSTVSLDRWKGSHALLETTPQHKVVPDTDKSPNHKVLLVLNVSQSGCKQNLKSAISLIAI